MSYQGYRFFIDQLELPYAPSELTVTIGSKNETVELINGNEINILKNPKLTEIKFECELPRGRQYAFANTLVSSKTYTDYFEKLMLDKKPTELVITRPNPGKTKDFESTVLKVSLEGYDLKESAENAYDIKVSLKFKEYIEYGTVKTVKVTTPDNKDNGQTVTKPVTPVKPVDKNQSYTIKSGDTLWGISKKFYGDGSKWETIYNANKKVIEDAAKKNGRASSSKGHWIYPNTKITIPNNKQ